jgi:carbon monoxide dehydrogenase subunit G
VPDISYTTTMGASRPKVWDFVRDMDNWAPFTRGYQSHEVIDDRESVWVVKGDLGPISRITKVRVNITEWVEGEKVGFTVRGLNEPVEGSGAILLSDTAAGARTEIRADATIAFGGSLGPVVNHLIGPFIESGADELVAQIVMAVTGEEVERERRGRLALALAVVWKFLTLPMLPLRALWRRGARPAPGG